MGCTAPKQKQQIPINYKTPVRKASVSDDTNPYRLTQINIKEKQINKRDQKYLVQSKFVKKSNQNYIDLSKFNLIDLPSSSTSSKVTLVNYPRMKLLLNQDD